MTNSTNNKNVPELSQWVFLHTNFEIDNFEKKQHIKNLYFIGSFIPQLSLVRGTF